MRSLARLPTGTVTFLFTDLEGSTRLWEAARDAMGRAVPRHNELITAAVEANHGQVFKNTGDGICAAFENPSDAIGAAVDAQQRLDAEKWPGEIGALRARMGIHTGSATLEGSDYLGPALNRAARLMAVGHGGQVLASSAVERLSGDQLPDGVTLRDLGSHRLRDLATPEHVFQIDHQLLTADFPRLRSTDSGRESLPASVTSFVGREAEIEALSRALGDSRLITLTGFGGVGKTRLAFETAAAVVSGYPDGISVVELAPVTDPATVPHAIAGVLGTQQLPDHTMEQSLLEALRPRTCLLVLDNCEHLLSAIGALAGLVLRHCRHVEILATSREPLAVEGEHVWSVGALAVPEPGIELRPDELRAVAAVVLFEDRARAARRGFEITSENASAVAEICRQLDGVPLALELAAARVRSMGPADLAARLGERFRLLRGGPRTATERHQTLQATVDWSYELLDELGRHFFDRCSVFAGGFALDAAEAVCADPDMDELDVAELAAGLVEKSMLTAEERADGTIRYELLETLRRYGEERLAERGETEMLGRRHAEYYARFAKELHEGVRGPDEARWVESAEAEVDNLRAAHTWAISVGDATVALGIPIDAYDYANWRMRSELFVWAEAARSLPGAPEDDRFADICAIASWGADRRGEFATADRVAQEALAASRARGADPSMNVYLAAGLGAFRDGDAETMPLWAEAGEALAAVGDLYGASFMVMCHAILTLYLHDDAARADELAIECERLAEQARNPSARAFAAYARGEVLQDVDPDRSTTYLEHALELARSVRNRFCAGNSLVALASVRARYGDERVALELLYEAVDEWHRRGNWRQQWVTLRNVVELFGRLGLYEEAVVLATAVESSERGTEAYGAQGKRLEKLRSELEGALGADRYGEASRRGRQMDDDDTVAFARSGIEHALDEQLGRSLGRMTAP